MLKQQERENTLMSLIISLHPVTRDKMTLKSKKIVGTWSEKGAWMGGGHGVNNSRIHVEILILLDK
jgi:hypothetical protein